MTMPWYIKVAGFKLLSTLPGGELIYNAMQHHVTRSTVPTVPIVRQKLAVGTQYANLLAASRDPDLLLRATHFDIGCGWMPTIPLLFILWEPSTRFCVTSSATSPSHVWRKQWRSCATC